MRKNLLLKKQKVMLFFLLIISSYVFGQTITPFLDPSIKFVKTQNSFNLLAERTDGKVWFTADKTKLKLQLLNENGTLNSFSLDIHTNVNALASVANNKVLVGGNFTSYNNTTVSARIVRLNADGSRDFDFSASSNANEVTALYILPNGKIMVGRNTQIQRLNEDGTTDTSFATVTTNGKVNDFVVSSNDYVIAVGDFTTVNGNTKNRIVSIKPDGTIDTVFNMGTGFGALVNKIRKSADDKLYVVGNFASYKGTTVNGIAKIDLSGNLDTTFHNTSAGFDVSPTSIGITQSNKLLIGGTFTKYRNQNVEDFIVVNTTTGGLETNSGYTFETGMVKHIIPRNGGGFLFSGEFVKYNDAFTYQVFKTSDDVTRVPAFQFNDQFCLNSFIKVFDTDFGSNLVGDVITAKRQNDKVFVSEVYINNKRYSLARFTNSGMLDTTFQFDYRNLNLPNNLKYSSIREFSFTPTGKMFLFLTNKRYSIAATNTDFNLSFLQLNADGSMDTSFNSFQNYFKQNAPEIPNSIGLRRYDNTGYIRNDGKILWAKESNVHHNGLFIQNDGTYQNVTLPNHLNLLKSNGSIDESYSSLPLYYADDIGVADYENECIQEHYNTLNYMRMLPLPNNETIVYDITGTGSYCSFGQSNNSGTSWLQKPTIARINSNGVLTTRYIHLNNTTGARIMTANYHNGYLYFGGSKQNGAPNYDTNSFFKKVDLATNNEVTFSYLPTANEYILKSLIKDNKIYILSGYQAPSNPGEPSPPLIYRLKRLNINGSIDSSFQTLIITRQGYGYPFQDTPFGEMELIDNPNENSFLLLSRYPFTINGTYYQQSFVKVSFDALSTNESSISNHTVKLYPNPTHDVVNVSSEKELIESVEVLDMQGRNLRSIKTNSKKAQIDIHDLPNAVYLVKVKTDKGIQTFKVIKN